MPEVRKALSFPLGHGALELATRRRIGKSLAGQYDQAILLPNSLKSALVPFFAGIPKRTGWRGEFRYGLLNDVRTLDKARYPLMIERFMALAYEPNAELPKPYPRPSLQIDPVTREAALAKFGLTLDRPVLALCPGAEFGESKRWPSEHYAKVAEARIREGWQVWLFGSKNDHAVGEDIRARLIPGLREESVNLSGGTSLAEAIDLLSCADCGGLQRLRPDARRGGAEPSVGGGLRLDFARLYATAGRTRRNRPSGPRLQPVLRPHLPLRSLQLPAPADAGRGQRCLAEIAGLSGRGSLSCGYC